MSKKGLYIRNVEGLDLYKFNTEEKEKIGGNWCGYIPYSLELIKLQSAGITKIKKTKAEGVKNVKLKVEDFDGEVNNKSMDLINVNFNCSYDTKRELKNANKYNTKLEDKINVAKEELKELKQLPETDNNKKKINYATKELGKLNTSKAFNDEVIKKLTSEDKKTLNQEKIREHLYINGFKDENNTEYVVYKRSGAKARVGKCLFIKKELADIMLNWSYMGIKFEEGSEVDIVSLGAYASLVSSSIEGTIQIDVNSILCVEDINNKFNLNCKMIEKGEDGLVVNEGNHKLESCPTDGSSLLDCSCFEDGIDFKLLRNHMFKSCAFKTDIQAYYRDYFKDTYETATVTDMFGNKMLAKDVKLIITPNSLKAFKFKDFIKNKTKADMFKLWKKVCKKDGNIFGVCKHNKSSKWKFDELEYNQMSYQMMNAMNFTEKELIQLTDWEVRYVGKLKSDIEEFKKYLILKKNDMNCNEAFVEILNVNKEFENTEVFRKFRTKTISKYVDKLKSGKIKNIGDYCTIIANPMCYLQQSVGAYDENKLELKDNEIMTTLFENEKELVCIRNPITSQSNVYIGKNTYNKDIKKYFGFGRNIIVVNCINNPICQIMSGMDMDSDNCLVYDNSTLLTVAKRCYNNYKVCENGIEQSKAKYNFTKKDFAKADSTLSKAKFEIGTVVNVGALAMAKYWDTYNTEEIDVEEEKETKADKLKKLQEQVDLANILNGVAIDSAKKTFNIKIQDEILKVQAKLEIDKKPDFWRYVTKNTYKNKEEKKDCKSSQNSDTIINEQFSQISDKTMENDNICQISDKSINEDYDIGNCQISDKKQTHEGNNDITPCQNSDNPIEDSKTKYYECSMDLLTKVLTNKIGIAKYRNNKNLADLLIANTNKNKADRKQQQEILSIVEELDKKLSVNIAKDDANADEKFRELDFAIEEALEKVNKKKVNKDTMLDMLYLLAGEGKEDKVEKYASVRCRMFAMLYKRSKKNMLECFVKNS